MLPDFVLLVVNVDFFDVVVDDVFLVETFLKVVFVLFVVVVVVVVQLAVPLQIVTTFQAGGARCSSPSFRTEPILPGIFNACATASR